MPNNTGRGIAATDCHWVPVKTRKGIFPYPSNMRYVSFTVITLPKAYLGTFWARL